MDIWRFQLPLLMSVLKRLVSMVLEHCQRYGEEPEGQQLNEIEGCSSHIVRRQAIDAEDLEELREMQQENEFKRVLVLFVQFNRYCHRLGNFEDFSASIKKVHSEVLFSRQRVDAYIECCHQLLLGAYAFNFAVLQSLYFLLAGNATNESLFAHRLNLRADLLRAAFGQLRCSKLGGENAIFANVLLDLLLACRSHECLREFCYAMTDNSLLLLEGRVGAERHPDIHSLRKWHSSMISVKEGSAVNNGKHRGGPASNEITNKYALVE